MDSPPDHAPPDPAPPDPAPVDSADGPDRSGPPGRHGLAEDVADDIAEIDARGLRCPLPVLKARRALATLPPGARLRIRVSDPMARIDLPHFCAEAGHAVEAVEEIPAAGPAHEAGLGSAAGEQTAPARPPDLAFLIRRGTEG